MRTEQDPRISQSTQGEATAGIDTDGDGMPDDWETAHFLNPNSAADATSDFDGDKVTALEEYLAGTNPLGKWNKQLFTPLGGLSSYKIYPVAINDSGKFLINAMSSAGGTRVRSFLVSMADQKWTEILPTIAMRSGTLGDVIGMALNDNGTVLFSWHDSAGDHGGMWFDNGHQNVLQDYSGHALIGYRINNFNEWVGYRVMDHAPVVYTDSYTDVGNATTLGSYQYCDIDDYGQVLGVFNLGGQDSIFLQMYGGADAVSTSISSARPAFDNLTARWNLHAFFNEDGFASSDFAAVSGAAGRGLDQSGRVLYFLPGSLQKGTINVPLSSLSPDGLPAQLLGGAISHEGAILAYASGSSAIVVLTPDQDLDQDGIPDDWEDVHGLNKNYAVDASADFDQDGISNLGEYLLGRNPVFNEETSMPQGGNSGQDLDSDGIPDFWEYAHKLNPNNHADAYSVPLNCVTDPDHDGYSNLEEYRFNTNPHGGPVFQLKAIPQVPTATSISLSKISLGTQGNADCVYFSGEDSSGSGPLRWTVSANDQTGSFAWYGSRNLPILAVSESGAIAAGGSNLTYHPSQEGQIKVILGSSSNTSQLSYVKLSPEGKYLVAYRQRASDLAWEGIVWQMPGADNDNSFGSPITLTVPSGIPAMDWSSLMVNDHGLVGGNTIIDGGQRSVIWTLAGDGLSTTPVVLSLSGKTSSNLTGISNSSTPVIAGTVSQFSGATLSRYGVTWLSTGSATLFTSPYAYSSISAVSPGGVLAGVSYKVAGDSAAGSCFVSRQSNGSWITTAATGDPLPSTKVTSVNDWCEVLGEQKLSSITPVVRVFWREGVVYKITDALPADYTLNQIASPLNANGSVLIQATHGGRETYYLLSQDIDTDGDGMPDTYENAHGFNPYLADDGTKDADGDGLNNVQEFRLGTDPNKKDTDGDGMDDKWEVNAGLDPLDSSDANLDPDGDGVTDAREYQLQTAPLGHFKYEILPLQAEESFVAMDDEASVITFRPDSTIKNPSGADIPNVLGSAYFWRGRTTLGGVRVEKQIPYGTWEVDTTSNGGNFKEYSSRIFSASGGKVTGVYHAYDLLSGQTLSGQSNWFLFDGKAQESAQFHVWSWNSISGALLPPTGWGDFPARTVYSPDGNVRLVEGSSSVQALNVSGAFIETLPSQNPMPGYTSVTWTAVNNNGDALGRLTPGNVLAWRKRGGTVTTVAKPSDWGSDGWALAGADRITDDDLLILNRIRSFYDGSSVVEHYLLNLDTGSVVFIKSPGLMGAEGLTLLSSSGGYILGSGAKPWLFYKGQSALVDSMQVTATTAAAAQSFSSLGWTVESFNDLDSKGRLTMTVTTNTGARQIVIFSPLLDENGDKIPDDYAKEMQTLLGSGTNPSTNLDADNDGDGLTLRQEIVLGTSDASANSKPTGNSAALMDSDHDGIPDDEDADPFDRVIDWKKPDVRADFALVPTSSNLSSKSVGPNKFGRAIDYDGGPTTISEGSIEVLDVSVRGEILYRELNVSADTSTVKFRFVDRYGIDSPIEGFSYDAPPEGVPPGDGDRVLIQKGWARIQSDAGSATIYGTADLVTNDDNHSLSFGSYLTYYRFGGTDGGVPKIYDNNSIGHSAYYPGRFYNAEGDCAIGGNNSEIKYSRKGGAEFPKHSFPGWSVSPITISEDSDVLTLASLDSTNNYYVVDTAGDNDSQNIRSIPAPSSEDPFFCNALARMAIKRADSPSLWIERDLVVSSAGLYVAHRDGSFVLSSRTGASAVSRQGWLLYKNEDGSNPRLWADGKIQSLDGLIDAASSELYHNSSILKVLNMSEAGLITVVAIVDGRTCFANLVPVAVDTNSTSQQSQKAAPGAVPDDFRKISFSGVQKSEPKPQADAETDLPEEDSYVDAYDRSLRYDTSFVYQKVPSSELALQATMSWAGSPFSVGQIPLSTFTRSEPAYQRMLINSNEELIGLDCGLFGSSWSSNLGAQARVKYNTTSIAPIEAAQHSGSTSSLYRVITTDVTVPDEAGRIIKFTCNGNSGDFHIAPSTFPRKADINMTLTRELINSKDSLVLKKKFGVVCIYNMPAGVPAFGSDYISTGQVNGRILAPLVSVTDIYGNSLKFTMPENTGIGTVEVVGRPAMKFSYHVSQLSGGRGHSTFRLIDSITDISQNITRFEYSWLSVGGGLVPSVGRVIRPDGGVQKYSYDTHISLLRGSGDDVSIYRDARGNPVPPPDAKRRYTIADIKSTSQRITASYTHIDLTEIINPLGARWKIAYESSPQADAITVNADAKASVANVDDNTDSNHKATIPSDIRLGNSNMLGLIVTKVRNEMLDSAVEEYAKAGGAELTQPGYENGVPIKKHTGIFAMPAAESPDVVASITLPDGGKTTFSSSRGSEYGTKTADFGVLNSDYTTVHSSFPVIGLSQREPGYTKVTDVLGNTTDYLFTDPVFMVVKNAANGMSAPSVENISGKVRYDIIAHKSIQIRFFGAGSIPQKKVAYVCDPQASFALEHSVDAEQHIVTYLHGEKLNGSTKFNTNKGWSIVNLNSETSGTLGDAGAEFAEPKYEVMGSSGTLSSEQSPALPFKKFEYDMNSRKMISSTDRNGNRTLDAIDAKGRRTKEDVYDKNGVLISTQQFYYDTTFPGFMIRSEVKKIPSVDGIGSVMTDWVQDLVTTYAPDDLGHTRSMTTYPDGPSVLGLTTYYVYDAAGRKISETDPNGNTTDFGYDAVGHLTKVSYPADANQFRAEKHYEYDLAGRKISETDERGNATLWQYDLMGRVTATGRDMNHNGKLDSSDLITRTQYNAAGLPIRVTDANGNINTTGYDDLLRPITVTDALGGVTRMDYSGMNSGSSLADGPGYKPTRIRNARGYVTIRTYDPQYRLTSETVEFRLPGDHAEGDEWQGDDWRTRTPADGYAAVTSYDYDLNSNVTCTKKYRTLSSNSPLVTQTKYDGLNRPTSVINALGVPGLENTTLTQYTSTGLIWDTRSFSGIEPLKIETIMQYDGAGRKTVVWTGNESYGDVEGVVPFNARVANTYDANGNVRVVTDSYGNQTLTIYDKRNRVTDVYAPPVPVYNVSDGSTSNQRAHSHNDYDAVGNLTKVTDPRGMVTEKLYDANNRPYQVTMAKDSTIAAITASSYDANGNVIVAKDANGALTRNRYDALNRLIITATNPYTGNPSADMDAPAALDVLVYNFYDAGGNLVKVGDGNARFWGASMAASTTNFTYDGLNRKIGQAWDKGAQTWPAPHSPVSNLSWKYDGLVMTEATNARGQKATYSYDALLRPTRIAYSDGTPSVDFYYKGAANYTAGDASYVSGPGPLVGSVHSGTSTEKIYTDTATSYDHLGRVTSEVSAGETQRYGYDLLGNRNLVSYAQTGRKLVTHYDGGNRVSEIIDTSNAVTDPRTYQASGNDKVTTYSYDIGGLVLRKGQANQTATINSYDLRGRMLTTITRSYPSSGFAVDLSGSNYSFPLTGSSSTSGYDAAGNVVHVLETYSGNQHREVSITYDWGQRITGEVRIENGTTTADSYGYDTGGNNREWRWSQDTSGNWVFNRFVVGNANTGNNANQLYGILKDGVQSAGNFPYDRTLFKTLYTYDADGNRSTKTIDPGTANETVENYSYDQRNRLIGFTRKLISTNQVQSECHYVYDERTRRTKTDEGGTVRRLSFAGGTYAQEYGVATGTQPALEIIRGSDMGGGVGGVLYHDAGNGMVYSNYNSRGDMVSQTNNAGSAVIFQAKYKAFGTHSDTGTAVGRQRANSKDEDPTGLLNEGMRYRDLEAAVFITRDPAGMVDGPNTYTYVRQNPWTAFDPLGLSAFAEFFESLGERFGSNPIVDAMAPHADTVVGAVHAINGVASVVPALGKVADASDAALYAAEGNYKDAAITLGAGKAGKLLGKVSKGFKVAEVVAAHADEAEKIAVQVTEHASGAEKVVKEAVEHASEATKSAEAVVVEASEEASEAAAKKPTGSYTNTHESGNKYHGKGAEERMNTSAKEKTAEYGDPVVEKDFKPAANDREAFKDEARRIREDGGVENPNNYNKINSPGEKYLKQDGE